jgi:hypothetical protein
VDLLSVASFGCARFQSRSATHQLASIGSFSSDMQLSSTQEKKLADFGTSKINIYFNESTLSPLPYFL